VQDRREPSMRREPTAISEAQELRRQGMPDTAIAARLGVTRQSILRWLGPRRSRPDHAMLIATAVKKVQTGETVSRAAHEVGLSRSSLRRHLTIAGVQPVRPRVPEETLAAARQLRAAGHSDRAIATTLGVSRRQLVTLLGRRTRRQSLEDRWRVRKATSVTLYQLGLTRRQVATRLSLHPTTVGRALAEAQTEGISIAARHKLLLPHYRRLWSNHDLIVKAQKWARI
jgi:transposase